eukprot:3939527-Rhodomonas_salina.1
MERQRKGWRGKIGSQDCALTRFGSGRGRAPLPSKRRTGASNRMKGSADWKQKSAWRARHELDTTKTKHKNNSSHDKHVLVRGAWIRGVEMVQGPSLGPLVASHHAWWRVLACRQGMQTDAL